MNKILMLAYANIRKTKGNTISLLIMFFIAALLLNAGLLVFINFGGFFHKTTEELNTSNIYYIMSDHLYNNEVEDYLNNNDNVLEMHQEESLWGTATVGYKDGTREMNVLLNDAEHDRDMSKWKFVGKHLSPDEMSIYLPYIFQFDGGYELNDKFEMSFMDTEINFTIKGFTEDIYFSSIDTGLMGVYLPHDTYEKVRGELNTSIVSKVGIAIFVVTIAVVILVLYFVISSLVIRKKHELGIQKAIGFTTFQLMNQITLGFLPPIMIGVLIGSLIGITQTNAIMSVAQRSMSIMKANYIITPVWIALFGVAILIVSYITSMLITYRIRKISAYALVSE